METSIADAICTSSTGSAILSISGGKKPYSISWQGAAASGAATSYGSVSIAGLAATCIIPIFRMPAPYHKRTL
ncbi:MAG: hypothetical protein H6566_20225 [Lewinellaceae bacterium]|nr:hypothetical protein [Lewinellaceae bacterium]